MAILRSTLFNKIIERADQLVSVYLPLRHVTSVPITTHAGYV